MYLYGASGHAKVIIDILRSQSITVEGLIDDNESINELLGYRVYHGFTSFSPMIVSIGDNIVRKRIVAALDCEFGTAVHTSAIVSEYAKIGIGTVVMQGVTLQSCVDVGRHCIINTGTCVDHECLIGNFVHLSPHVTLCGNVKIGEGAWIGAGCVVIPGVKIGKWSVIGAGSVVCQDIPDGVLAVGNRCKIIRKINQDL